MRNFRVFCRVACALVLFSLVVGLWSQDAADDTTTVAAYSVAGGKLSGAPKDQAAIWKAVVALVPPTLLNLVENLEFFEVKESESDTETDGWALQSDDGQSFTLGLNLANAKAAFVDRDTEVRATFEQTIVHEFGHVLSFRASQMDENAAGTLQLDEGTLKPDAYLNVFYDKFWKKAYPGHSVDATSDDEGTRLYLKAPDAFVSEYAATGPLEDFAESFAWFVSHDKPQGKTTADQKVLQFWVWPELVGFRDDFRKNR